MLSIKGQFKHAVIIAMCSCSFSVVYADTGKIEIINPADGAKLNVNEEQYLDYDVTLGERGNHIHVWVDGDKGPAVRSLKGSYELPKLSPGKHAIIVKVVDAGHIPTGPEKSVFIEAK